MLEDEAVCNCECYDDRLASCCIGHGVSSPSPDTCSGTSKGVEGVRYGFSFGGSEISRFVNNYSPVYDKPFEPVTLTSERYLDRHLCEVLGEDRLGMLKFHRTTDKKGKALLRG